MATKTPAFQINIGEETDTGSKYVDIRNGGNGNEPIYVTQYSSTGSDTNRITLLDKDGNTTFPGDVHASRVYVSETPNEDTEATSKNYVDNTIDNLEIDMRTNLVTLDSAQTITGTKTYSGTINSTGVVNFSGSYAVSVPTPTEDEYAANKAYVDSAVSKQQQSTWTISKGTNGYARESSTGFTIQWYQTSSSSGTWTFPRTFSAVYGAIGVKRQSDGELPA